VSERNIPPSEIAIYGHSLGGAVAVNLSPDDLREIESAASQITIQGARYPEYLERMTGL